MLVELEVPVLARQGREIALARLKPHAYQVVWPTNKRNAALVSAVRSFYDGVQEELGDTFREAEGKLFRDIEAVNKHLRVTTLPLEDLRDEAALLSMLRFLGTSYLRVNTPYADVNWQYVPEIAGREVPFSSHLNHAPRLSALIRSTHTTGLSEEEGALLVCTLNEILTPYN